jgi:acetyl esterase/lipase
MSRVRRVWGWLLKLAVLVLLLALCLGAAGWWYFHPATTVTKGVVYTQRHGQDLTLEVHRPERANGLGVLFLVSGKWKSQRDKFEPWLGASFFRQGFTVFAVTHLAQPEATVAEIVEDMHRAVRFVRHHAADYGVNGKRLGVTGGSSGGHLSLMLATRGGPGRADAADSVDREDSSVQAVAVFFPVTDLLNLGSSTENDGTGGPPMHFKDAFGPGAKDIPIWREEIGLAVSPIFHIGKKLPPILIAHGDADTLVPLDQSQRFQAKAAALGHPVELWVAPGGKHGWLTMLWDVRRFGFWLEAQLRGEGPG